MEEIHQIKHLISLIFRVNQEDFELEFEENKAVLQCRKTPISRNSR